MSLFTPPHDPSLTMRAAEVCVEDIPSQDIQSIIDLMLDVAKGNQIDLGYGVLLGLAAPQIGILKRIIIVDVGVETDRKDLGNLVAFINPQIIWYSDEISWGPEGCYSVDDHIDGKIPRSEKVHVVALDREGRPIDKTFSGFTAKIFQHEVDHLNGIRFPDRVGKQGVLHWIPDNQYNQYLEQWEDWPLMCPWQIWLNIKEGRPYEFSGIVTEG